MSVRLSSFRAYGLGRDGGFTVVELVLVIVILGVLSAMAGPRFFGRTEFSERSYRDEMASAVRYGQKIALASGCPVRVVVLSTGYVLNQQTAISGHCDPVDASFATPVLLSNGQTVAGTTPSNVGVGPDTTFRYGAAGGTDLPGDQTINVGAHSLTIRAASGLVETP